MKKDRNIQPQLMETPVIAGFPSPAKQYIEASLDLNELRLFGVVTAVIHQFVKNGK